MRLPLELVMMVVVYVQDFKKDKFLGPEKFMDDDDVDNYILLLNVYTLAILFAPKTVGYHCSISNKHIYKTEEKVLSLTSLSLQLHENIGLLCLARDNLSKILNRYVSVLGQSQVYPLNLDV